MYATTGFPHHVHWSSSELADAVPRRLSEIYGLVAATQALPPRGAAHPQAHARTPQHFLPASSLPGMFRVN
ncbi:hypothetical protein WCE41_14010 [Luteimonas sp. MJ246]|uniref:hypothetical protein n=1 Tax=Luteimonas sp. MJ174 TaxID=3129237 RepID=UPI0031BA0D45